MLHSKYSPSLDAFYKQQLVLRLTEYKFFPGCIALALANLSKDTCYFFQLDRNYATRTEKIIKTYWYLDKKSNRILKGENNSLPYEGNYFNYPILDYFNHFFYFNHSYKVNLEVAPVHHIFAKDKKLIQLFKALVSVQEQRPKGIDSFLVPAFIYLTKSPLVAQSINNSLHPIKYTPQYQALSILPYSGASRYKTLRRDDIQSLFYDTNGYEVGPLPAHGFINFPQLQAIRTPLYFTEKDK